MKEMMKPSWHTGKQAVPTTYCQLCFRELSTGALRLGSKCHSGNGQLGNEIIHSSQLET